MPLASTVHNVGRSGDPAPGQRESSEGVAVTVHEEQSASHPYGMPRDGYVLEPVTEHDLRLKLDRQQALQDKAAGKRPMQETTLHSRPRQAAPPPVVQPAEAPEVAALNPQQRDLVLQMFQLLGATNAANPAISHVPTPNAPPKIQERDQPVYVPGDEDDDGDSLAATQTRAPDSVFSRLGSSQEPGHPRYLGKHHRDNTWLRNDRRQAQREDRGHQEQRHEAAEAGHGKRARFERPASPTRTHQTAKTTRTRDTRGTRRTETRRTETRGHNDAPRGHDGASRGHGPEGSQGREYSGSAPQDQEMTPVERMLYAELRALHAKIEFQEDFEQQESPFTQRLEAIPKPKRSKSIAIKFYDGTQNPNSHIQYYEQQFATQDYDEQVKCRQFASSLQDVAQEWFAELPPRRIDSFDDFRKAFLSRFRANKPHLVHTVSLEAIYQHEGEDLDAYIRRFKEAVNQVRVLDETEALSIFRRGVDSYTYERYALELIKRKPKNLAGAYALASNHISDTQVLSAIRGARHKPSRPIKELLAADTPSTQVTIPAQIAATQAPGSETRTVTYQKEKKGRYQGQDHITVHTAV